MMSIRRTRSFLFLFYWSILLLGSGMYGDAQDTGDEVYWAAPKGLFPSSRSTYNLSSNHTMPMIGLGVHMSAPGQETHDAVWWALKAGYRLVDTAAVYQNEESVGEALETMIRDHQIPRDELFVTTKLASDENSHGYESTLRAFEESRAKLKLDYLDLYLIHSPYGGKLIETWDALLELQRRGRVRSIGVSNFDIKHLEAIKQHGRPLPAVNQIEMHPLIYQERKELLRYCQQQGILVQAYGSIFFGSQDHMEAEPVTIIAHQVRRTPAQVLLRWGVQHQFQIIPKSVRVERILENMQVFDFSLSQEQMTTLDQWSGQLGAYWNPLEADVNIGDTSHWPPSSESSGSDEL